MSPSATASPIPFPEQGHVPAATPDFVATESWRKIRSILDRTDVSDLLLDPGAPIAYGAFGSTHRSQHQMLASDFQVLCDAVHRTLNRPCCSYGEVRGSLDAALIIDGLRFRVNLCTHSSGARAVMRLLKSRIPLPQELNMPLQLRECALTTSTGLILIAGPPNAGKSTTMASLIKEIASSSEGHHIITVEDPIEYIHEYPTASVIMQREVGTHEESFELALRSAMRQMPSHILVGEIRDQASAQIAMAAAETGRLVLSSMHGASVVAAIERFLALFSKEDSYARSVLAHVLQLVVAQKLVPIQEGTARLAIHEVLRMNKAAAQCILTQNWSNLNQEISCGQSRKQQSFERALHLAEQRGLITRAEMEAARMRLAADK